MNINIHIGINQGTININSAEFTGNTSKSAENTSNEGYEKDTVVWEQTEEKREKREKTEIGIHAIRGGTIVGEHDIIFAGRDEIIELNHKAMSKDIFAVGAVKAAKFLAGQKAGLYTMKDVMD